MTKPFLFIGIRAEDDAADGEYEAILRCAGLDEADLRRVRIESVELGPVEFADWSGIIVGGGPWNVSDPAEAKSPAERKGEARLRELALAVVAADFPFLGACYGVGTLGSLPGGVVDRTYGEPIGAMRIELTDAGRSDPLLGGLPGAFDAFLGHKEAVRQLPDGAVLLASSATCPVQAFRMGARVYATQFHPELDCEGLVDRIRIYADHGYFVAHEEAALVAAARAASVTEPPRILSRFVELFAR
jgi:GMP synthase (glutamine-hydrolysing)